MIKTLRVLPLFLCLLILGCGKGTDNGQPADTFGVSGVHDVDLGITGGNVLPLNVTLFTGGLSENLRLSLTGLPAGVTANISPASDIPPFKSTITFGYSVSGSTPGTYPITLVATPTTDKPKSYDFKLTIPTFSGWTFNNIPFRKDTIIRNVANHFLDITSSDGGGTHLFLGFSSGVPTASGTYRVVNNATAPDEVEINFSGAEYWQATGTDNKTATILVSGGKYRIDFEPVAMFRVVTPGTMLISAHIVE